MNCMAVNSGQSPPRLKRRLEANVVLQMDAAKNSMDRKCEQDDALEN